MAARSSVHHKPATEAQARLRPDFDAGLLEALPIACAVFGRSRTPLVAANRAFVDAFGTPLDLDAFDAQFEGMDARDDALPVQRHEVLHGSTRRWFEIATSPFRSAESGFILVSATDITERQAALRAHKTQHEKLLFTSRTMSVGEMATTLAHELNQPLAAIINYLGVASRLLSRESLGDDRVLDAMHHARGQAEHAAQVVTRLREFVRAREPRREAHRPSELVETVLRLVALEAERHRVRIEVDIAPTLPDVSVDRIMVEQVLLNLAKNGIEAMREAPTDRRRLDVRARLNLDDQVEFRIVDRGCGLSEDDASRLFTPFFTTKAEGMGIGLTICRSIVEYHEGRLYFERNPEGGSMFVFTLPVASNRGEPA